MKAVEILKLSKDIHRTLSRAGEGLEGLRLFADLAAGSPEVLGALENPAIPLARRLEVFRSALDTARIPPGTRAVLLGLLHAYALHALPQLADLLERRELRAQGVEPFAVRVASGPAPEEQRRIEAFLASLVGKPVRARFALDAGLLGGFTARSESYFVDASMRGMVHKLTTPEEA